jgi:aerobic carbon-monoxide dehydrogenase small subunit
MYITFTLNGAETSIETEPLKRLLDTLRDDLGLTGTKEGCGEGECGACSVLVNGRLMNACLMPTAAAEGADILTIEGYRDTDRYAVLAQAFSDAGAVQCGFCTPGMVMAAEALLRDKPKPTEADIREGLSGNLCRCTGYAMIIEAVLLAAERGDGLW